MFLQCQSLYMRMWEHDSRLSIMCLEGRYSIGGVMSLTVSQLIHMSRSIGRLSTSKQPQIQWFGALGIAVTHAGPSGTGCQTHKNNIRPCVSLRNQESNAENERGFSCWLQAFM